MKFDSSDCPDITVIALLQAGLKQASEQYETAWGISCQQCSDQDMLHDYLKQVSSDNPMRNKLSFKHIAFLLQRAALYLTSQCCMPNLQGTAEAMRVKSCSCDILESMFWAKQSYILPHAGAAHIPGSHRGAACLSPAHRGASAGSSLQPAAHKNAQDQPLEAQSLSSGHVAFGSAQSQSCTDVPDIMHLG